MKDNPTVDTQGWPTCKPCATVDTHGWPPCKPCATVDTHGWPTCKPCATVDTHGWPTCKPCATVDTQGWPTCKPCATVDTHGWPPCKPCATVDTHGWPTCKSVELASLAITITPDSVLLKKTNLDSLLVNRIWIDLVPFCLVYRHLNMPVHIRSSVSWLHTRPSTSQGHSLLLLC